MIDTRASPPLGASSTAIENRADLKFFTSTSGRSAFSKSTPSTSARRPPAALNWMRTLVLLARGMSFAVMASPLRLNWGTGFSTSPKVHTVKSISPKVKMSRGFRLRNFSASMVAPTESPRKMVTMFMSAFWAVIP